MNWSYEELTVNENLYSMGNCCGMKGIKLFRTFENFRAVRVILPFL